MDNGILFTIFTEIDKRQAELDFECSVTIEKPLGRRELLFTFRYYYGMNEYAFQRSINAIELSHTTISLSSYLDLFFTGLKQQRTDLVNGLIPQ